MEASNLNYETLRFKCGAIKNCSIFSFVIKNPNYDIYSKTIFNKKSGFYDMIETQL